MASYERQTWVDLQTPLDAAHMNHIEEGIASIVGITSIKQTTTSTADGGNNVITATLDNGTTETFNIKNGSKGSTGSKGDTGAAGVGIKSVVQTTTSSADGGNNVITVTKTDGTTSTFVVKNGSKGSTGANGAKGADGYTPVKGVDYWTPADQESIAQQVIAALGTPVFGTVDADNNIILSGELADGTYTFKYEDAEGHLTEIGTLEQGGVSYTNQLPLAIASDKTPFNGGQGWKTGYRLNSTGAETAMDGMEVTGFIPVQAGDIVRLQNVGWTSGASQTYAWCYDSNFNYLAYVNAAEVSQVTSGYATLDSSGNLVQFTADANFFKVAKGCNWSEINSKMVYFRINCVDISENSIITVNQPIE